MKHILFQETFDDSKVKTPYVVLDGNDKVHFMPIGGIEQPTNEIWYTSSNGQPITPTNPQNIQGSVINIISNTWDEEVGYFRMKFDGEAHIIGEKAFYASSSLTSINIPDSVTSIGDITFLSCSSLASVMYDNIIYTSKSALITTLTDNNVTVGVNAFSNTALED